MAKKVVVVRTDFTIGDRVVIVRHNRPGYVGLAGKVVWRNNLSTLYQITTETKPKYYRPANPPWHVTVAPGEIKLLEKVQATETAVCVHHEDINGQNQGTCIICGQIRQYSPSSKIQPVILKRGYIEGVMTEVNPPERRS